MNIRNPHTEFYEPAFIDEEDGIDGVFVEGEVPEGVGHAAIVKKPNQIKSPRRITESSARRTTISVSVSLKRNRAS